MQIKKEIGVWRVWKNYLQNLMAQHPNVFLTAQAVKKWLLHSNRILPL